LGSTQRALGNRLGLTPSQSLRHPLSREKSHSPTSRTRMPSPKRRSPRLPTRRPDERRLSSRSRSSWEARHRGEHPRHNAARARGAGPEGRRVALKISARLSFAQTSCRVERATTRAPVVVTRATYVEREVGLPKRAREHGTSAMRHPEGARDVVAGCVQHGADEKVRRCWIRADSSPSGALAEGIRHRRGRGAPVRERPMEA